MFAEEQLDVSRGPNWVSDPVGFEAAVDGQVKDWYDNFFFSNGARIAGRSPSARKLWSLGLPQDLSGLTVLDIGAYEGYYSFHLEQRRAQVTANDHFVWNAPDCSARDHFDFVRFAVNSSGDVLEAPVDSLSPGSWDITLFGSFVPP